MMLRLLISRGAGRKARQGDRKDCFYCLDRREGGEGGEGDTSRFVRYTAFYMLQHTVPDTIEQIVLMFTGDDM
jgi:hypothetical protein